MSPVTTILAVAVLLCAWSGTSAADIGDCDHWGYRIEQGAEWPNCWDTCRGDAQSPIDIETKTVSSQDMPHLSGTFYDDRNTQHHFTITNNNHTVKVQLVDGDQLYLEGGPLEGRYFLDHLTFSWGSEDDKGSEHTVNGMSFPMEAQWGLFSEEYSNYEEASQHPGGVLRMAQLMDVQQEDNPSLAPIVAALPSVRQPGETASPDESITYSSLFPDHIDTYYYYNGSLTTPPCYESVIWLVYLPMHGVSESQLAAFRELQSTDGPMVNNYRQTQPLDERVVGSSECSGGQCETRSVTVRHGRRQVLTRSVTVRHQDGGRHVASKSGRHAASKSHRAARRRPH